jgi:hypothetical protein
MMTFAPEGKSFNSAANLASKSASTRSSSSLCARDNSLIFFSISFFRGSRVGIFPNISFFAFCNSSLAASLESSTFASRSIATCSKASKVAYLTNAFFYSFNPLEVLSIFVSVSIAACLSCASFNIL